jgi:hypothetical protein
MSPSYWQIDRVVTNNNEMFVTVREMSLVPVTDEITLGEKHSILFGIRRCIQKFPEWVDNEIHAYNNKHSLGSNTTGYGGKTHWTDSPNSDTTASSGRELYHLQFSRHAASPETFGYTLVNVSLVI